MNRRGEYAPRATVVIASYRWPEALELSLASALAQTVDDIEILVVEDGADTASRQVVAEAADPRVRWLCLEENSGSQQGPNTLGWSVARAPVVAYLGHDDLWHPEHLQGLLAALDAGADLAHSMTVVVGPPPDDWLMFAGGEVWTPETFVSPTSIAHLRDSPRLGRWRRPEELGTTIDYGFLLEAHECGAVVDGSLRPTAWKFPAAWRLDVYATRDISLQLAAREALAANPRRGEELVAQARADGTPLVLPALGEALPGAISDYGRRMKGLASAHGPRVTAWTATDSLPFPGWFPVEGDATGGWYRWTGLHPRAIVRLDPPHADRAVLEVRVVMAHWLDDAQLGAVQVDVDGAPVPVEQCWSSDQVLTLVGRHRRPAADPVVEVGITAPVQATGVPTDGRRLGVAVRSIALVP